jgi:ABC-type uncharacterized transport system auxiliary subunit
MKKGLVLIGFVFILGCGGVLSPVKQQEIKYYTLDPINVHRSLSRCKELLLITKPNISRELQSHEMFYIKRDYELESFALSKWSTPPSDLFRKLLVYSFRKSLAFKDVIDNSYGVNPTIKLNIDIQNWYQDFRIKPSQGVIEFYASVIDVRKGTILASKLFVKRLNAEEDTPYGGVYAFNKIMEVTIPEIIGFVRSSCNKIGKK